MRRAIVLTAFNRPDYLSEVLDSWSEVRDLEDWDFYISIDEEDSESCREVIAMSQYFQNRKFTDTTIIRQSPKLGVLKHPYVVLDTMFSHYNYDFVVRAEDDLVVSDGILEYFDYTSRSFSNITDVKTVHAFSRRDVGSEASIYCKSEFNSWIFGTWKRAWPDLRDNWDLDYSTYNGTPMNQSGFDWNFDTRVYPTNSWYGVFPEVSRVKNIGAYGVHGTPENLPASPTFVANNEIRRGNFELQL